jgi:hypothetical protein
MHRPFTTVVAAFVLVATLAACGPGGTPAAAPTTLSAPASSAAPSPTAASTAGWTACTNATKHFAISYPPGWHTASAGPEDACSLFDPAAFAVVDGAPVLVTQQLHAFYASMDRLEYFAALFPHDFFTVVSQSDVTVGGNPAIRYTVTTLPPHGPSGPTYPVGTTLYGYVVTAGPDGRSASSRAEARSIDVGTWAAPTDASLLPARQAVVDLAATTVRFSV